MPIPPFDTNLVLPPHLGNPTEPTHLSPYPATCVELCNRFGTSPERREILNGLLRFRAILQQAGFLDGFHWLDGSFLEEIETRESRHPRDLDVVTFYLSPDPAFSARVAASHPILFAAADIRAQYRLHHYFVDISWNPVFTVEYVRYWTGLFSHRRDGVWKGMLKIGLNSPADDDAALKYLSGVP